MCVCVEPIQTIKVPTVVTDTAVLHPSLRASGRRGGQAWAHRDTYAAKFCPERLTEWNQHVQAHAAALAITRVPVWKMFDE